MISDSTYQALLLSSPPGSCRIRPDKGFAPEGPNTQAVSAHPQAYSISLVIPAFNEERNVGAVLDRALRVLKAGAFDYEILLLDDGSTDGTLEILRSYGERDERIRILTHERNEGTGKALLDLFREARGDFVLFLPADGQVPADELMKLLPSARTDHIIVGLRRIRKDGLLRLLISRTFHGIANMLFGTSYRDINSVTLYRREVIEKMPSLTPSLLIQFEILVRAERMGYSVKEVGIAHYPRVQGRARAVNPASIARMLADLVRLRCGLGREERAGKGG
jgi:glycosyltransferase involved in cell wall biosynthesis